MASVQNTDHQQRIDLGQRLFLLSIFAVLVVELVGIFVNIGASFTWPACLFNIFAGVFILSLGNWMYNGDKTALGVARLWATLMTAVVCLGLVAHWVQHSDEVGRFVGITSTWLGLLKLAAYALLGGCLLMPGYVLDYLAAQRGETIAPTAPVEHEATMGTPVELTTEHTKALDGLAAAMKNASWVLLAVGLLDVVCALSALGKEDKMPALLGVVEGLAVMTLGCLLLPATGAVQALLGAAPRHMGYVVRWLQRFQALYLGYTAAFAVLAVVAVCRLIFIKS